MLSCCIARLSGRNVPRVRGFEVSGAGGKEALEIGDPRPEFGFEMANDASVTYARAA